MEGVDLDPEAPLRDRIRWGNVARAAALVTLLAVIVAWPSLGPREPELPPSEPVPVATQAPPPDPGAVVPSRPQPDDGRTPTGGAAQPKRRARGKPSPRRVPAPVTSRQAKRRRPRPRRAHAPPAPPIAAAAPRPRPPAPRVPAPDFVEGLEPAGFSGG
jgi:hypothetical protein